MRVSNSPHARVVSVFIFQRRVCRFLFVTALSSSQSHSPRSPNAGSLIKGEGNRAGQLLRLFHVFYAAAPELRALMRADLVLIHAHAARDPTTLPATASDPARAALLMNASNTSAYHDILSHSLRSLIGSTPGLPDCPLPTTSSAAI